MQLELKRAIYEENDKLAKTINSDLRGRNIFVVNILGSPGAGKTSLILALCKQLISDDIPVSVIEGDIASDIDAQKLKENNINCYQIETGGNCHLNAAMIKSSLNAFAIEDNSWLFIENIGNLVCTAEYVIGEDIKLLVASVTEGSDKPFKYPFIFQRASACVLGKIDLADAMEFNMEQFKSGLASTCPHGPCLSFNGKTGQGSREIYNWLSRAREQIFA